MFKLLAEIRHNAPKNPIQNYKIKTVNCKKISMPLMTIKRFNNVKVLINAMILVDLKLTLFHFHRLNGRKVLSVLFLFRFCISEKK